MFSMVKHSGFIQWSPWMRKKIEMAKEFSTKIQYKPWETLSLRIISSFFLRSHPLLPWSHTIMSTVLKTFEPYAEVTISTIYKQLSDKGRVSEKQSALCIFVHSCCWSLILSNRKTGFPVDCYSYTIMSVLFPYIRACCLVWCQRLNRFFLLQIHTRQHERTDGS